MESVGGGSTFFFWQNLRTCQTCELPSGNWLQRCSFQTSRWHKGSAQQCKWAGRSVHPACSEGWLWGQEHFILMSPILFSSQDWTHQSCPWLLVQMFSMEIKLFLTYANTVWRHVSVKRAQTQTASSQNMFSPSYQLREKHLHRVFYNPSNPPPQAARQVCVVRSALRQPDSPSDTVNWDNMMNR